MKTRLTTPGKLLNSSIAAWFPPCPSPSPPPSALPTKIAFSALGSEWFILRSAKMSAVANGLDDQMMRRRGKVRVRRTRRDWMSESATARSRLDEAEVGSDRAWWELGALSSMMDCEQNSAKGSEGKGSKEKESDQGMRERKEATNLQRE